MSTQYSDIYIDGLTTEELHADGGQIVEAWLDGECIWKLVENYLSTTIYYITWYNGMYYAVGNVRTQEYGYNRWYISIFVGRSIDNLKAYRAPGVYYSYPNQSSIACLGISCDENGVWMAKQGYGHMSYSTPIMMLHSGFSFVDKLPGGIWEWFLDNSELNIPKSMDGVLSVGNSVYYGYPEILSDSSEQTLVYKNYGQIVETVKGGYYGYVMNIMDNAYLILSSMSTKDIEKRQYDWYNCQSTPNPYYNFPLMYIREPVEWKSKGIVYFPLGEIYQSIKEEGCNNIEFSGAGGVYGASNEKCIIITLYLPLRCDGRTREYFWVISYDGLNLKYKSISGTQWNEVNKVFTIGEKFAFFSSENEMHVFDSIDEIYTTPLKFTVKPEYANRFHLYSRFFDDKYLYLLNSNTYTNTITWLKTNLETLESIEETIDIASK